MTARYESAIVRIRAANGRIAGAGFLVAPQCVITCAHVVATALNLSSTTSEVPQSPVCLDFPLVAPNCLLDARVVLWKPSHQDDIAGLELEKDPPPGVQVGCLVVADDLWGHPFQTLGFPSGYENGVYASGRLLACEASGWVQVEDVKPTGYFVAPGFSGSPVWDESLSGIAGMVVAAETQRDIRAAFMISASALHTAWRDQIPPPIQAGPDYNAPLSWMMAIASCIGALWISSRIVSVIATFDKIIWYALPIVALLGFLCSLLVSVVARRSRQDHILTAGAGALLLLAVWILIWMRS